MGSKRKLIVSMVLILLIAFAFVIVINISQTKETNYTEKLISVFDKHEKSAVKDIFSFEFERAYIFNDCYISGDGFATRYNLDISIPQVNSGTSENIQRIVFVDEQGKFVYEFKCDINDVVIEKKGIIIYPETIIERTSSAQNSQLTLNFNSTEHYDS